MCPRASGKGPFSRGRVATGSKAWTASATTSCASAGRAAGWWRKTPSWCTWTETTAGSTLCCCSTRSSKWRWAAPSRTPSTECASRTSPGRSAASGPKSLLWVVYFCLGLYSDQCFVLCAGIWSLSAAATDRPTGGVMKSTIWQTPVISWKCNASTALHRREKIRLPNGLFWKKQKTPDIDRLSCNSLNSHHLAFVIGRYVNGSSYFADLADALEQAKEEIFITDWW